MTILKFSEYKGQFVAVLDKSVNNNRMLLNIRG